MSTHDPQSAARLLFVVSLVSGLSLALVSCTARESGDVHPKAGPVAGLPPGIVNVTGTCSGKIALTPTRTSNERSPLSYPATYDCMTGKFELLETAGAPADEKDFGDLNLTADGYYVNEYIRIGRERYGGYSLYGKDGRLVKRFDRPQLDPHDILVGGDSILYMKYTTPESLKRVGHPCGIYPIELELVEESRAGEILWTWKSTGRLEAAWSVVGSDPDDEEPPSAWKRALGTFRHCYTGLLKSAFSIETPSGTFISERFALFQIRMDDYIHANSISRVGAAGDILVSARHLDTLFLVDKKSGAVKWSLGGPKAKMSLRRPAADPRGGFSRQHSASIQGNSLYVFDNGNNLSGLASRAVVYAVEESRPDAATFSFEFLEPNGLQRPAGGSVEPIGDGRLLIGWGAMNRRDEKQPTRAVSIVDTKTGREEFAMDFAPGWESYRARHSPR